jgi:glycosyltransferase involved in cell wall biosynthesis
MDRSERIEYSFYGSGEPLAGIVHADTGRLKRFVKAPYRLLGRIMWQPEAVKAALSKRYDAIIYLGDPNFASTWAGAAIARVRGVPVLFWAHGWLRESEKPLKARFRRTFFRLADRMLVYGERAKRLGMAAGYSGKRITVVYNSLDVDRADAVIAKIESGELESAHPRDLFSDPSRPLIICTARITPLCRFDLLLEAADALSRRGMPINMLLVGDGPERPALDAMAKERGLALHFYGACYDEDILGQLIYRADLTVSPGKIGLSAMHSLMYGTPAITHDNLEEQMPEVEAVTEGVTGALFRYNDAEVLADTVGSWMAAGHDRKAVRDACRKAMHDVWNPHVQATIIEQAVREAVHAKTTP